MERSSYPTGLTLWHHIKLPVWLQHPRVHEQMMERAGCFVFFFFVQN